MLKYLAMGMGGLLAVIGLVACFINKSDNIMPGIIIIVIGALAFSYGLSRMKERKATKAYGRMIKKSYGVTLYGIGDGEADCTVTLYKDYLSFIVNKLNGTLALSKVSSAYLKQSSQLKGASLGNVVAGGVLFGTIGVILASRPKNVKSYVFIVNYYSDGEKSIAIEVAEKFRFAFEDMVKYINKKCGRKGSYRL